MLYYLKLKQLIRPGHGADPDVDKVQVDQTGDGVSDVGELEDTDGCDELEVLGRDPERTTVERRPGKLQVAETGVPHRALFKTRKSCFSYRTGFY